MMDWLQEKIQAYQASDKPWWKRWFIGPLIFGVTMILIGVYLFQLKSKGQEIANLKHKLDVANTDKVRAEADRAIARSIEESEAHAKEAQVARERADSIQREIDSIQDQQHTVSGLLQRITSWDDVDRIVR